MNFMRHGTLGASAALDAIMSCINLTKDISDPKIVVILNQKHRMKEIISTPSKYDMMVACLQPCLSISGKLERASLPCLT